MLDLRFIRENPELVKAGLAKKKDQIDIDRVLELDENRREIIREVEKLKAAKNSASAEIAKQKKAGESADDAIAAMKKLGQDIAGLDARRRTVEEDLNNILIWIPNLPDDSAPVGPDESANEFVRDWGVKPKPTFEVKPHWEIGEQLGLLDFTASARISGSGFYILKGLGARLERALINYMLDLHTTDGFIEYQTPFMVTADTMFGTGQLPKLGDDMYHIEQDDMYLIPTGEVPLTNMFRGEIIDGAMLPMNMVTYTPCFRREAGAAGTDTRGMIRVHQFDKVELVRIVRPEESEAALEDLTRQAEKVLQGLGLHYRVVNLATGDLSFASAKTYDLEVWSEGVRKYLEISSVSTFGDFQTRRMNCRFRDEDKKVLFPHTLNGSGVALARMIPAILENYQNADGTINIPAVLQPYMGGLEKIG